MKFWVRILFIGIVAFAVFFICAHIFLVFKGKALFTKQIEAFTGRKTTLGSFVISPPLKIQIKKLAVDKLANVDSLVIAPSIVGLLLGNTAVNDIRIIKPEFTFERNPPHPAEAANAPEPLAPPGEPVLQPETPPGQAVKTQPEQQVKAQLLKILPQRLILKRILIKDGKINFVDHAAGDKELKIVIKDIYFTLTNLYFIPKSVVTNFTLKGNMPWQEGSSDMGKIEAKGWFNFFKKDMEASVNITDIDGVYLYPYYSTWVDLEKARIAKAKLNFYGHLYGANNNITTDCHLELADIVRKELEAGQAETKDAKIADALLDIFKTISQGKVVLDFTIRTKMDRPEFGFDNIRMAFESKITHGRRDVIGVQDFLMLPSNILQGAVRGVTELSKSVISGTFAVGQELKKSVEDTFRKEKR